MKHLNRIFESSSEIDDVKDFIKDLVEEDLIDGKIIAKWGYSSNGKFFYTRENSKIIDHAVRISFMYKGIPTSKKLTIYGYGDDSPVLYEDSTFFERIKLIENISNRIKSICPSSEIFITIKTSPGIFKDANDIDPTFRIFLVASFKKIIT